jgi:hypothetical protein
MSYTVSDVLKAVDYFVPGGEHTWDMFLSLLRKGPVQLPINVGKAEFVEEYVNASDGSYGYETDNTVFVFKIANGWYQPGERFWRVTSESSSFGGLYFSDLEEVQQVPVQKLLWERV